jgi:hypothetical protein
MISVFKVFNLYRRNVAIPVDINYAIAVVGVIVFCLSSFSGNIFGPRISGLFFGVLVGYLIVKPCFIIPKHVLNSGRKP